MSPQDFTYWLQGFVEMTDADTISDAQWKMIKDHLKLTMNKQTPDYSLTSPSVWQQPHFDLSRITCSSGNLQGSQIDLSKALVC